MGSKYTVKSWGQHNGPEDVYSWNQEWAGRSLWQALIQTWRAKRRGFGCVVLEIR